MRFLADENIPQELIDILTKNNVDIVSIRPKYSGISDEKVVELSNSENRTIITADKGFGKLIFQKGIIPTLGLILIRENPVKPDAVADNLLTIVKNADAKYFERSILVLDSDFIKRRNF